MYSNHWSFISNIKSTKQTVLATCQITVLPVFNLKQQCTDNHDSGYLIRMAVQLYVQAHLGHYYILT